MCARGIHKCSLLCDLSTCYSNGKGLQHWADLKAGLSSYLQSTIVIISHEPPGPVSYLTSPMPSVVLQVLPTYSFFPTSVSQDFPNIGLQLTMLQLNHLRCCGFSSVLPKAETPDKCDKKITRSDLGNSVFQLLLSMQHLSDSPLLCYSYAL